MARPPKTASYDADDETILAHFDEAMELAERQKESGLELSAHNTAMHRAGVDPGTMTICRRLALMKPGKRGIAVALLHRYLSILASRLEDPTVAANGEARSKVATVPFSEQRPAA